MKKVCACLLALVMVIGVTGCSADTENQTSDTPSSSSQTTSNKNTIKLNESISAGGWQYTLVDIQFADDIGNYSEYEEYLVPGGKKSSSNPFLLEESEMFAVVTYKLKNIGPTKQYTYDQEAFSDIGTGKFVYGDGYTFESQTDGKRARAYYYDATVGKFTGMDLLTLEPLSEEIECRVAFCISREVVEDESKPLIYEVSFDKYGDNMVLTYTIR